MAFPELTVCREFSAERINSTVNHPQVRPWVGGGTGLLDLSSLVADPCNVLLMAQGGGVLFQQLEPGLYEGHTQFVPEARGKHCLQAVRDALHWMFLRHDAFEIVTKVPDDNRGALGLGRALKFELQFHRPNSWSSPNGLVGCGYYSKSLNHWVRDSGDLAQVGDWFHDKLAAAKLGANSGSPIHDDDDAHDRYVGAATEMILSGQVAKGIGFYNRWARFAGYGLIAQIATNPVVIDIGDAILAVRGNDFEVLLCR